MLTRCRSSQGPQQCGKPYDQSITMIFRAFDSHVDAVNGISIGTVVWPKMTSGNFVFITLVLAEWNPP